MEARFRLFAFGIVIAFSSFLAPLASAAVVSQANLYSTIFADPKNVTVGGGGVPSAQIGKTGSATPAAGINQQTAGWSLASAASGRLAFTLDSAISVASDAAISSYTSANIQSTNNMVFDDFTIGAGVGPGGAPLGVGDTALVLAQTSLDAEYQYQGRPSSLMMLDYSLGIRQGGVLQNYVDFNSGNILPVAADEIHHVWSFLLPVTIGETFTVESRMSGWVGGSAFDRGQSGLNFLYADPLIRISNAPGYTLDISSAAGAPTSPIPLPPAVWLFASGLVGLFVIVRRRN